MSLIEVKAGAGSPIIYCTSADRTRSATFPAGKGALRASIKLGAVIGAHTYISARHLLDSQRTFNTVLETPDLIESGIVVVGLRDDCRDFLDFAELSERLTGVEGGYGSRAKVLNSRSPRIVRYTPTHQSELLKRRVVQVLSNPASILRRRLTATPQPAVEELARRINNLSEEAITRRNLASLAVECIPRRVRAFMREVNILYYSIGAHDKGLIPDIRPDYFADISRGVGESIETPRPLGASAAFREILNVQVLPDNLLARMSLGVLVRLRQRFEGEFRRFRQKWWAIAESARESASLSETTCHPGLADRVRAAAEQELRDDRNWSRKSKVISVSSLVFSVASLVPHPTLAALSFLASAVSYLADTAPVRERLVDSRFRVVCSRLARHAHAKK